MFRIYEIYYSFVVEVVYMGVGVGVEVEVGLGFGDNVGIDEVGVFVVVVVELRCFSNSCYTVWCCCSYLGYLCCY